MTFSELRGLIDDRIQNDPRLNGSRHDGDADISRWSLNDQTVTLRPNGSTGILVEYHSGEHTIHSRIFAASPLSVDRIVTTVAEHLTAYALHRM